jgi:probable HAF family extracellular repeat protein
LCRVSLYDVNQVMGAAQFFIDMPQIIRIITAQFAAGRNEVREFGGGEVVRHIRSAALAGILLMGVKIAHATEFSLLDLGSVGQSGQVTGLNDEGQISGFIVGTGGFVTQPNSPINVTTDLIAPSTPQADGTVLGLNNHGMAIGQQGAGWFLYDNGAYTQLPTGLTGINDSGVVVGRVSGQNGAYRYVGGQVQDIGNLGRQSDTAAWAINNAGQIVGQSTTNQAVTHAFLWDSGKMTDLGSLTGPRGSSTAFAISDNGQVLGIPAVTSASPDEAFVYTNGKLVDIGRSWGISLFGAGINNAGQAVGGDGRFPRSSLTGASNWRFPSIPPVPDGESSRAPQSTMKGKWRPWRSRPERTATRPVTRCC